MFWLDVVLCVVGALIAMTNGLVIWGVIILFGGIVTFYFLTLFLVAFGSLVENSEYIARSNREIADAVKGEKAE